MPSSRRRFLAGAAGTAICTTLAGCTGALDEPSFSPGTDENAEWRFPDYDRRSTAYNPDAAAPRNGVSKRWTEKISRANGRPVVADGSVFVPTWEGLVAFDLESGEERWSFSASERSWAAAPTVYERTVLAGFADDRGLRALDAETGEVRWSVETRGSVKAPPLPSPNGERVFVGDDTGRVYVVKSDGEVEHTYDAVGGVTALAGGTATVVVGTNGGQVYEMYDDGEAFYPLWRARVAGGVQDVALDSGRSAIVSVFGQHVYKLRNGAHAGSRRWRTDFTANEFVLAEGTLVGTNLAEMAGIDAFDGEKRWSREGNFGCAPAAAGDTFYVGGSYDDDSKGGYVAAYPLGGGGGLGGILGDAPSPRWKRDVSGFPAGGLTVADGALLVPEHRRDESDRLHVFDPA